MKTIKLTFALAAALFSATSFTGKLSAFVNVIPVDIPDKAMIQVTFPFNTSASVYIYDATGTVLHSDQFSPDATTKFYDFSNLRDGVYTFESYSDHMNITKKIGVKGSKIEILSKETEIKPFFSVEENELKVNYLNKDLKDVELSVENTMEVFYQEKMGKEMSLQKKIYINNLRSGDYFAKLKAGGKTYYHNFKVK